MLLTCRWLYVAEIWSADADAVAQSCAYSLLGRCCFYARKVFVGWIKRIADCRSVEKLDEFVNRVRNNSPLPLQQVSRFEPHTNATVTPLFALPPELVHTILSYLSPYDLAAVSSSCRTLRSYASSELHWHRCVQRNVPGFWLTSPGPCKTFRELYRAHDRLWFLPRYKIWFSDQDLMGKLVVVRYDHRRGCIEGYQLLAVSSGESYQHWSTDQEVVIHGFEPKIRLHVDKPVLQFHIQEGQAQQQFKERPGANRFADEMPMTLDDRLAGMYSNFMLTHPLDRQRAEKHLASDYPYGGVWPPPAIPARHHVSGARSSRGVVRPPSDSRPKQRSHTSDQTFRIRQWMELAGTPPPPAIVGQPAAFADNPQVLAGLNAQTGTGTANSAAVGIHIGEEIITYSTLDPVLYNPTATKPWRGIWVGDYSGHGCEFLLINQPDDPPATDEELGLFRGDSESDEKWAKRRLETRQYRGRLEAVKLTGDPNIPRGEYSFVADDLGPEGFVGVATDSIFAGARIVKSKGHVAATGFLRGACSWAFCSFICWTIADYAQINSLKASSFSCLLIGWRSTGSNSGI